jgi:hypothetical protein
MDRALCEPDLVEQCERAIAEIRIADAGRSELRLTFSIAVSVGIRSAQVAEVEHNSEETTAR